MGIHNQGTAIMFQPDMFMLRKCGVEIQRDKEAPENSRLYVHFPKRTHPATIDFVRNFPESSTIFYTSIQEELALLNVFHSFYRDKTKEEKSHIRFASIEKGADENALLYALTDEEIELYNQFNNYYIRAEDPPATLNKAYNALLEKIGRDHILPTQMAVIIEGDELIKTFQQEHGALMSQQLPRQH